MDVALLKIDLSDTFENVKAAVYNADRRVLALVGFTAGSYVAYQALDFISTAGKTENTWLRKMHEIVRVYWNRGPMMKYRHFFSDSRLFVVNYGSYGVMPRPVLQYKWRMQVSKPISIANWVVVILKMSIQLAFKGDTYDYGVFLTHSWKKNQERIGNVNGCV